MRLIYASFHVATASEKKYHNTANPNVANNNPNVIHANGLNKNAHKIDLSTVFVAVFAQVLAFARRPLPIPCSNCLPKAARRKRPPTVRLGRGPAFFSPPRTRPDRDQVDFPELGPEAARD